MRYSQRVCCCDKLLGCLHCCGQELEGEYALSVHLLTLLTALMSSMKDHSEIKESMAKVEHEMEMYNRSMTNLNASMLRQSALKSKKKEMLEWLLPGRPWEEKHTVYCSGRVENIGDWVLRTPQFLDWYKHSAKLLLCDGARITHWSLKC